MRNKPLIRLTLSAMFIAIGLLLPMLTGQIREIGNMLLPMHIPVLLCGFICGWPYGLAVGFIMPLLRSAIFGMPVMFPGAVSMAFELLAYGFMTGLIYGLFKKKGLVAIYTSLIAAMIAGRIVWGAVRALISGLGGAEFTWQLFMSGAFLTAVPGIIIQLILIPVLMLVLEKAGVMKRLSAGK